MSNCPSHQECPNCGRPLTSYGRYTHDGPALLTAVCDDCGVVGPVHSAPRMPEGTADPVGLAINLGNLEAA